MLIENSPVLFLSSNASRWSLKMYSQFKTKLLWLGQTS